MKPSTPAVKAMTKVTHERLLETEVANLGYPLRARTLAQAYHLLTLLLTKRDA